MEKVNVQQDIGENQKILLQQALDMLEEQTLHIGTPMLPAGEELLNRIRAALSRQAEPAPAQDEQQPQLTVWEGSMPESNGKSNFTAVLMRKGSDLFDGISGGMTIARSEYPDRVRYEADCVRWLIGEIEEEPCITDYDSDKHSGYAAPIALSAQLPAPERVKMEQQEQTQ